MYPQDTLKQVWYDVGTGVNHNHKNNGKKDKGYCFAHTVRRRVMVLRYCFSIKGVVVIDLDFRTI